MPNVPWAGPNTRYAISAAIRTGWRSPIIVWWRWKTDKVVFRWRDSEHKIKMRPALDEFLRRFFLRVLPRGSWISRITFARGRKHWRSASSDPASHLRPPKAFSDAPGSLQLPPAMLAAGISKRIRSRVQAGSLQVALSKKLRPQASGAYSKLTWPKRFRYSPRTFQPRTKLRKWPAPVTIAVAITVLA